VVPSGPVFGFSLSELIVVIVVALVVIGPKDLPKMLRKLGQYAGKLRRMASDLRHQSGIDEALRTEGLADDIAEIRKLARGELDAVQRAAVSDPAASTAPAASSYRDDFYVVRDREYPRDGADSYGALPDNAIVYAEGLPKSKLARDPVYMLGDPEGIVPEPPPPPVFGEYLGPDAEANAKADADAKAEAEANANTDADTKADGDAKAIDPSDAETADPPAVAERPASEAH
jgi:sec-independent protein translocase protein TatB